MSGYRYWHPCYMGSVMMVSMTFSFTLVMLMLAFIATFCECLSLPYHTTRTVSLFLIFIVKTYLCCLLLVGVAVVHNFFFPENVRRDGFKYAPVSAGEGDRDLELVARGSGGGGGDEFDSLDDPKQMKQHSHAF